MTTSSSISASEAGSLTPRLRSVNEDFDRNSLSQTPTRRTRAVEDRDLTFKPSRHPSVENAFPWQGSIHSSKANSRWSKKLLIPLGILLLLLGFVAGRTIGGVRLLGGPPGSLPSTADLKILASSGLQKKKFMRAPPVQLKESQQLSRVHLISSPRLESTLDLGDFLDLDADFTADDLALSATEDNLDPKVGKKSAGVESRGLAKQVEQKVVTKEKQRNAGAETAQVHRTQKEPVKYASSSATQSAMSTKIGAQHVRIYIAELPRKYNLDPLEAIFGLGSTQGNKPKNAKEEADTLLKEPFGQSIGNAADMLYTNHPHNLDVLFYTLIQSSPLKTNSPEEADAILVPFWVNKFIKLDQELEKPNRHDLAFGNFWNEVETNLPYLGKKPHLLVVPGQEDSMMGSCGGHGLDFLCNPKAKHLTILTPEVLVGKAGVLSSSQVAPGMINKGFQPADGSVAVPDFANIHFPQAESPHEALDHESLKKSKTKLISEAFRARAPIRKLLRLQCLKHSHDCVHMEPQMLHSHNSGQFSAAVVQNDRSAWFSLQPPGDSAMRTSMYSGILAGAIPVIFDAQLAKVLPFTDMMAWDQLFVHINAENITSSDTDIVDLLKAIPIEERVSLLLALHGAKHLIQYSRKPHTQLVRFDSLDQVTVHDDAFTMSLKAVFRRLCGGPHPSHKCNSGLPEVRPGRRLRVFGE